MTETTIPTHAVTETPKPVKTRKAPKKAAKKTTKAKRPAKVKKVKKATKAKAAKKTEKPAVRWGSLMSINNDELLKAIKGEKNAMSAQSIAKKFKCTIWTAKRSVLRLQESGAKVQMLSRQEGKAGVPSACYFIR